MKYNELKKMRQCLISLGNNFPQHDDSKGTNEKHWEKELSKELEICILAGITLEDLENEVSIKIENDEQEREKMAEENGMIYNRKNKTFKKI